MPISKDFADPLAVSRTYNVVSAQVDDAALSCSPLLAANPGSCVTTIFPGGPSAVRPLTRRRWSTCRRHLTYWDRQYRSERCDYAGPSEEELAVRIADELGALGPGPQASARVIPLGLGHRTIALRRAGPDMLAIDRNRRDRGEGTGRGRRP